jgi:hypothetical protein
MTALMRRVIISVIAAVAVAGIGWAFSASAPPKKVTRPGIEAVSPPEGDLDLRQVQVGVDLAPGYTGTLYLDNVEIPEDDLHRVPAVNSITLKPQNDSPFRQLSPGRHVASVVYWPIAVGRSQEQRYTWRFSLH